MIFFFCRSAIMVHHADMAFVSDDVTNRKRGHRASFLSVQFFVIVTAAKGKAEQSIRRQEKTNMTKRLLGLWGVCVAMIVAAQAATGETQPEDADISERCRQKSKLAESIMSIKQHGGTVAEMMSVAGDDRNMKPLITKVFEEERHYAEKAQKQAVADLEERIYSDCMDGKF